MVRLMRTGGFAADSRRRERATIRDIALTLALLLGSAATFSQQIVPSHMIVVIGGGVVGTGAGAAIGALTSGGGATRIDATAGGGSGAIASAATAPPRPHHSHHHSRRLSPLLSRAAVATLGIVRRRDERAGSPAVRDAAAPVPVAPRSRQWCRCQTHPQPSAINLIGSAASTEPLLPGPLGKGAHSWFALVAAGVLGWLLLRKLRVRPPGSASVET
jgi:hypothetical protein